MEKKNLVVIQNDEGRAGTKIIAKGFDRRHEQITRLVNKYRKQFEEINTLNVFISKGKTKNFKEFFLDEYQFAFLATLFKNNDKIVEFKLRLILDYRRIQRLLKAANKQKDNPVWNQARLTGKTLRLMETNIIQKFIVYAKNQGGSEHGCNMYYSNITRMMNTLLFICEGQFKNLREVLTPEQLIVVGSAEQVIKKTLEDAMEQNIFYKDIYKKVKEKIMIFADLHGQSDVISKHLTLRQPYKKLETK